MLCDESRESQLSGKQLAFLQQPGLRDKQINADTQPPNELMAQTVLPYWIAGHAERFKS